MPDLGSYAGEVGVDAELLAAAVDELDDLGLSDEEREKLEARRSHNESLYEDQLERRREARRENGAIEASWGAASEEDRGAYVTRYQDLGTARRELHRNRSAHDGPFTQVGPIGLGGTLKRMHPGIAS